MDALVYAAGAEAITGLDFEQLEQPVSTLERMGAALDTAYDSPLAPQRAKRPSKTLEAGVTAGFSMQTYCRCAHFCKPEQIGRARRLAAPNPTLSCALVPICPAISRFIPIPQTPCPRHSSICRWLKSL